MRYTYFEIKTEKKFPLLLNIRIHIEEALISQFFSHSGRYSFKNNLDVLLSFLETFSASKICSAQEIRDCILPNTGKLKKRTLKIRKGFSSTKSCLTASAALRNIFHDFFALKNKDKK